MIHQNTLRYSDFSLLPPMLALGPNLIRIPFFFENQWGSRDCWSLLSATAFVKHERASLKNRNYFLVVLWEKKPPQYYLEIGRTQVQTIWLHCNECHVKTGVLDRVRQGTPILIDLTATIWIHSGLFRGAQGIRTRETERRQRWEGATRGERLGRNRAEEDNVGASRGHRRLRLVPLTPVEPGNRQLLNVDARYLVLF